MKTALMGSIILVVMAMTACTSSPPPPPPPQPWYGHRPLTDVKGPRIYSRTNAWKLLEQQDQEKMRHNSKKNLEKRLTYWDSIKGRVARQNALKEQKEKERKANDRRRFSVFY